MNSLSSLSFDHKIVEADFCFNKCRYHNHTRNWCHKYGCSINDVDCNFIHYDRPAKTLLIGDNDDVTPTEEEIIWKIIKKEEKEGKNEW